jgi:hypothetical protein
MALSDELISELNSAVDTVIENRKTVPEDMEVREPVVETPEIKETETEPEEPKEPVVPDPVKTETPKVDFRDEDIERAVRLGMSIRESREFPTAVSLTKYLDRLEAVAAPKADQKQPVVKEDVFKDLPELKAEDYDDNVLKVFKTFRDVITKQSEEIAAFKTQSSQVANVQSQYEQRELEDWFDRRVGGLGADYEKSLGVGPHSKLSPGSAQYAKREELAKHMAVLMSGYKNSGQQVPSRDEVFDLAARTVCRDDYLNAERKRVESELEDRSKQHISRPNRQAGISQKSTREDIAAMIDEKFFNK